jgi:flagellar hook-associated protein 3 FlgL
MTLYRVSTANTYDRALFNIQQRQSELGKSQSQLSSGKRVQQASDDAVAATLSERTLNRLARTESDLRALEASRRSLAQAESTLGTASDLYNHFKELVVKAGDAALNASDKRSIADEMKGVREQLLSLANQKDTAGQPLFAGMGPLNPLGNPFVEQLSDPTVNQTTYGPDGKAVQWDATRGQQAATETALPKGMDGYSVFKGVKGDPAAIAATTAGALQSVSVKVTTPNPDVFDTSADALGGTQGKYAISYTPGTPATWTVTQTNRTNTPLPPAAPAPYNLTPAQVTTVGQDVVLSFDGMEVSLHANQLSDLNAPATFNVTPAVDRDIWETMDRAIGALEQGESGHDLSQELDVVHNQLAVRQDQMLTARGQLGDWLNRADDMSANFTDRTVAYKKENSELVDVDMVKAVSDFQANNTAYQAALQSYAKVQKQSLFDYIR